VSIYKYYYVLAGIFVLGYYSYLSYDKKALARLHDAGIWKKEYELHFDKDSNEIKPVNEKALHILDSYD